MRWCVFSSKIRDNFKIEYNFSFHSNAWNNGAGFHIVYKTLQQFTDCGGNYSNKSGILSSPSYPNPYPNLAECVYLISQSNGTYINISFLSVDVDCQEIYSQSDFIEMRDGSSEDSALMARFCGNGSNVPDFMQTTQNYLRIRWNWMQ